MENFLYHIATNIGFKVSVGESFFFFFLRNRVSDSVENMGGSAYLGYLLICFHNKFCLKSLLLNYKILKNIVCKILYAYIRV